MAKAKKSESSSAKKPAGAAKSLAAKPKGAPKSGGVGGGAGPFVDTNLAAQAAARMLMAKKNEAGDQKKSGGLIDQLKADLNKHPSSSVAGVLDKSAPPGSKKSHLPFGPGGKQVAHNQTYGADVTRSGVPRRTPG